MRGWTWIEVRRALAVVAAGAVWSSAQVVAQPAAPPPAQPAAQPPAQPTAQPSGQPAGPPAAQPAGQPTAQPTAGPAWVPGEILVKFKAGVAAEMKTAVMGAAGLRSMQHFASVDVHRCSVPAGMDVEAAVQAFRSDPSVAYAEPNYIYTASRTPDDPRFGELWGLQNANDADIDAPEAWDLQTGAAQVLIAIIDTGVDYGHEDLQANVWRNPGESGGGRETNGRDDDGNGFVDDVVGWDFAGRDNDPMDDNGHGTHVAGTIAAAGDNHTGVVGVGWRASLMALKFLTANGSGTAADAIAAIEYAARSGARVLNNSWGGGGFSQALRDAIELAGQHDALFVAAAGNSGRDNDRTPEYPASYDLPNVLAVAASDRDDALAGFSNFGMRTVHLAAPGVDILSTVPGNAYRTFSGTSMATPHASGAAALVRAQYPTATARQVMIRLAGGAEVRPAFETTTWSGGRLNVAAALTPDPKVAFVTRLDATPGEAGPYEVAAEALGDTTIVDVRLDYRVQDGESTSVPMQPDGPNAWRAEIPAQPTGVQLAYFVEVADAVGRTARSRTYTLQIGDPSPLPGCGVPFPTMHTTQSRLLFVLGNMLVVLLGIYGGRRLMAARHASPHVKR